ncbi:MAG TPA: hypothetical protein VM935_20565 [Chitinophagaceae bacterium]|nr:hypothetical protein [Chitinophagaceae bacterium]
MNNRNSQVLKTIITCLLVSYSLYAGAQNTSPKYDKRLADSLGSDDNGMKRYVLAILKTGTATGYDKIMTDSLFRGHMQNIGKLAKMGKLVVAGPLQKNGKNYRGIFILNVSTIAEAALLLDTDPAIRGRLLDSELYGWYGSAALPLYLPAHETLQKKSL